MKHQIINTDLRTDLRVTTIALGTDGGVCGDRLHVHFGNGAILADCGEGHSYGHSYGISGISVEVL
ncbi:MAG: hypothetical protein WBE71_14960 [Xanthobacteraceae bacterium]